MAKCIRMARLLVANRDPAALPGRPGHPTTLFLAESPTSIRLAAKLACSTRKREFVIRTLG
jgi:hypothetical protein